jgi:beta-phosphoglucomutase-like phosphatase (HAD superfamily)
MELAAIMFDFDGVIADCQRGVLLPGAEAFVRAAGTVIPLGIASGAMTHEIDGLLQEHDLRHLFTAVIGADQTARNKPSPDPYLEAFHRLTAAGHALDPSRTVAIDDSVWGLVSARTARLRCVGIGKPDRQDELAPHAELVVPGLDAVTLDTLDRLVRAATHRTGRPAPNSV